MWTSLPLLPLLICVRYAILIKADSYIDYVNPNLISLIPLDGIDLQNGRDQIFQKAMEYASLQDWGCFCDGGDSAKASQTESSSEQNSSSQSSNDTTTFTPSSCNGTIEGNNSTAGNCSRSDSGDTGGQGSAASNSTDMSGGTSGNSTGSTDDSGGGYTYDNSTSRGTQNSRTFGPGENSDDDGSTSDGKQAPSLTGSLLPSGDANELDPTFLIGGLAGTDIPSSEGQACQDFRTALANTAYAAWYNAIAAGLSTDKIASAGYLQAATAAISDLTIGPARLTPSCAMTEFLFGSSSADITEKLQEALGLVVVLSNSVAILRSLQAVAPDSTMDSGILAWAMTMRQYLAAAVPESSNLAAGLWYTTADAALAVLANDTVHLLDVLDNHFKSPEVEQPQAILGLIDLQQQVVLAKMGDAFGRNYWDFPIGPLGGIPVTLAHLIGNVMMIQDGNDSVHALAPTFAAIHTVYGGTNYLDLLKSVQPDYAKHDWWLLNQSAMLRGRSVSDSTRIPRQRDQTQLKRDDEGSDPGDAGPATTSSTVADSPPLLQTSTTTSTTSDGVFTTSAQPVAPESPTTTIQTGASTSSGMNGRRGMPTGAHHSGGTVQRRQGDQSAFTLVPTSSSTAEHQPTSVYTTSAEPISPRSPTTTIQTETASATSTQRTGSVVARRASDRSMTMGIQATRSEKTHARSLEIAPLAMTGRSMAHASRHQVRRRKVNDKSNATRMLAKLYSRSLSH